ncbi:MAG: GNAT family N-acetyltransferase [Hydrococcus sp. RM1_1_31]|nr:GNAT family N-acetyltransferase [Hydrococcus sp. RM1_1_31]
MSQEVKIASSQEELCRIYLLRYAVYIEEMGFPFPLADHEKRMLYDEYDDWAIHFYIDNIETDDVYGIYRLNLLKFGEVLPELESRYCISAFKNLGLQASYSSKLMTHISQRNLCNVSLLLRKVFEYGVDREYFLNFIDCSPDLVPFYERIGFRKYYSNFTDAVLGEKIPMVLFVKDIEHLKAMKSPLYKICLEKGVKNEDYSLWLENNFNMVQQETSIIS